MSVDDTLVSNKDASEEKENVQPSDVTKAHGITAAVKSKIIRLATFQTRERPHEREHILLREKRARPLFVTRKDTISLM